MRASRVAALLILCCAIGESSFLILARFHAITVFPIISSSKQIRLRRGPSRASFASLVEISRPIGSIEIATFAIGKCRETSRPTATR